MLSVVMLNVVMLNVIMLNVIMLNVVMLSVVAPKWSYAQIIFWPNRVLNKDLLDNKISLFMSSTKS